MTEKRGKKGHRPAARPPRRLQPRPAVSTSGLASSALAGRSLPASTCVAAQPTYARAAEPLSGLPPESPAGLLLPCRRAGARRPLPPLARADGTLAGLLGFHRATTTRRGRHPPLPKTPAPNRWPPPHGTPEPAGLLRHVPSVPCRPFSLQHSPFSLRPSASVGAVPSLRLPAPPPLVSHRPYDLRPPAMPPSSSAALPFA